MNSVTLDITDILNQDLKSRSTVADLRVFIEHQQAENVKIDFSKVLFATRSFIDEYYNQFIKDGGNIPQKYVETIHVPDDIQSISAITNIFGEVSSIFLLSVEHG